ncbi:hypothetical protein WT09_30740 [Burkholderia stagnalis]|uniref:hypothetical protein n=1 Tax=Burkholderia stagnalis TaxID=1503054 RepID=UPI00075E496D|nr:hypothetical protein [Burkholderia stagnalis]KVN08203.1 hypothetical protein WT09_30740 [Burkholderia stagnalis]
MSNSTTLLDTISSTQANKEVTANGLFDAASPAMIWGRHASATSGLTWGYYGGQFGSNAIANGTVTLTASTTNYIFADQSTGAVSVNTTGFPAGKIPLYSVVTGSSTATSYLDYRSYQPASIGGSGTVTSVALTVPTQLTVSGSPITGSGTLAVSWQNQSANTVLAGPSSGSAAAPTMRALVGADLPIMGASGSGHAVGAVPDPGSTAGSTKFLCENGTWAVPAGGGGGGGGTVTDVAATGGIETASGSDITTTGTLRANLLPTVATSAHTFVTGDRGTAIVMNSSSAVSQALPTPGGSNYPNGWYCDFTSIGTGTTTLSVPSGLQLDGVTNGTLALSQFAGVRVFTDGSNWFTRRGVFSAPAFGSADTAPVLSNFSWVNQGNVVATQQTSLISLLDTTGTSGVSVLKMSAPSTPYKIAARIRMSGVNLSPACGLCFYDSTNSKLVIFTLGATSTGPQVSVLYFTNATTFNSNVASKNVPDIDCWLRVRDDGTNLYADVSCDGYGYLNIWSASRTAWLSTPNSVGFFVSANTTPVQASVNSWVQT